MHLTDDDRMPFFELADALLARTELTPGQLAELRAINTMYQTALASAEHDVREQPPPSTVPPAQRATRNAQRPVRNAQRPVRNAQRSALLDTVVSRLRDMLRPDQRPQFERNLAALRAS